MVLAGLEHEDGPARTVLATTATSTVQSQALSAIPDKMDSPNQLNHGISRLHMEQGERDSHGHKQRLAGAAQT